MAAEEEVIYTLRIQTELPFPAMPWAVGTWL